MKKINSASYQPRGSFGRISCVLCISLWLIGSLAAAQSKIALPPRSSSAPDLQLLVVSGAPDADMVNFTYPTLATTQQLHSDLGGLAKELNVDAGMAKVTNSALPMTGVSTPEMTSVTLRVPGAAPLSTGTLPVEKLILGLHNYHRLAITYIMPPNFRYTGFHRFANDNLDVSLNQSGSTYTYLVNIRNPNFSELVLPANDASASALARAPEATAKEVFWFRTIGLILVGACAVLVGWGVYAALTKLQ